MKELEGILQELIRKKSLSPATWQQLERWELEHPSTSQVWGIDRNNVREILQQRSQQFLSLLPLAEQFPLESSSLWVPLWQLWLPLAQWLVRQRNQRSHPLVQGILGLQGTGKTTMARSLSLILEHWGYAAVNLSLDDLYKSYTQRQQLQQEDPRLIWRGPPGTHDVASGIDVLDRLRQSQGISPIAIPRFDKSAFGGAGDRGEPEWVYGADIIFFEGWFVGVQPLPSLPNVLPEPIVTESDRAFSADCNQRLYEYLPLWKRLDSLVVLSPSDYRYSLQWRREAEQKMKAAGKSGQTDAQIEQFVKYFWKALHPQLYVTPLLQNGDRVDLVTELDATHNIAAIYAPATKG
jgi:D-glycerate 3-kinase